MLVEIHWMINKYVITFGSNQVCTPYHNLWNDALVSSATWTLLYLYPLLTGNFSRKSQSAPRICFNFASGTWLQNWIARRDAKIVKTFARKLWWGRIAPIKNYLNHYNLVSSIIGQISILLKNQYYMLEVSSLQRNLFDFLFK